MVAHTPRLGRLHQWWTQLVYQEGKDPLRRIDAARLIIDHEDVATFGRCTPGPCDLHDTTTENVTLQVT